MFHVGTLFAGSNFESLLDSDRDNYRLKELVIQQYLFDTDDGWVLRGARSYRGARQIEDEERSGEALLQRLLSNPVWVSGNFLPAQQLVQVVPHPGAASSINVKVRNLAVEIAELDPDFAPLRARLHGFPSRGDLEAVRLYRTGLSPASPEANKADALLEALHEQYSGSLWKTRLTTLQAELSAYPEYRERLAALSGVAVDIEPGRISGEESISKIAEAVRAIRIWVESSADGTLNLKLLDLSQVLLERALVLGRELPSRATRREVLSNLDHWFGLAYGAGFLSGRESESLRQEMTSRLPASNRLAARDYRALLGYLSRSLEWAHGTCRQHFGAVHQHYAAVEEKASSFLDAMLRSSVLLELGGSISALQADADRLLQIKSIDTGITLRGLNTGLATGKLHVLEQVPGTWVPDPTAIYVLPEASADLRPVAGLISIGGGNVLSHVQLLARALQIPNAAADAGEIENLRKFESREVIFAVSPLGVVFLRERAELTAEEQELLDLDSARDDEPLRLDSSRLRLDSRNPLPLFDLRASDSGVLAGPKAANLGQLSALFPGNVAKGVVLPFGLYARHVDRPFEGSVRLSEEIRSVFQEAASLRGKDTTEDAPAKTVFPKLARLRTAIRALPWIEEDRRRIEESLQATFGPELASGVFVRSDTNVEDLPKFSGAGLNLTVAHLKSVDEILAAVKLLWASPFSERAFLWRSRVLAEQTAIYPSVLILASVPSDKSGVLVTEAVESTDCPDCLTIATAEGVGGAVQGEAAELIEVRPDGSLRPLSQAKAPFKQVLSPDRGGTLIVPTNRSDYLLSLEEIRQLQEVGNRLRSAMPGEKGTSWDLEFGFADGKLWLFQVRPFIPYQSDQMFRALSRLDRSLEEGAATEVDLSSALTEQKPH